ncbi:cyclophilin [Halteromyces radiatus]|uniref:cyclophilin n=1 Tax=Halteromyces radiatus TaxID=101107 RepID=UPI00222064E2|nr:cyclophilin [Halteromyces radiatus]KAI8086405.1 cyclophilin [Halteromyces radiatus]
MPRVYIDIAIGDIDKYADEQLRYNKAKSWVAQWATTYGLNDQDLDKLEDQDRETVRDILANDPTAQQEKWSVDAPPSLGGGRLELELYDQRCPKTCDNFVALCQGGKIGKSSKKALHYKSTHLFRLVPNFMIQGGDVTRDDGSGGDSIYSGKFNDEKTGLLKFIKKGQLAMANSGKNTNTSQFFITLKDREDNPKVFDKINGKYVIFGQVIDGLSVLDEINNIPVENETPKIDIVIVDCGLL